MGTYNASVANVPQVLTMMLQDQAIAMHFESTAGPEEVIGVITDNRAMITQYRPSPPARPTLRVRVSPGTVERLIAADSGMEVLRAIGTDIRIQGVGLAGFVKTLLFRLAAWVARLVAS